MNVFITGGTGFIGSYLIPRLLKKNYTVTALVRNSIQKDRLGKMGVNAVIGDITNQNTFIKELKKADLVIHLAAIRSNWGSSEDFKKINSLSVKNLFINKSSIKHIIITSSVYAMGKLVQLPSNENSPLRADDIYGLSKILAEQVTKEQSKKFNIPYTIIRPAIVYGPADNDRGMIIKMIKLIDAKRFFFLGNGQNLLHLIYIDDLIEGYLQAIKKGGKKQIYILSSAKSIILQNLANLIKKNLKSNYKIRSLPKWLVWLIAWIFEKIYSLGFKMIPTIFSQEPPLSTMKVQTLAGNWFYDMSKAKKELGFNPKVGYDTGIKKTVDWYLKNR